MSSICAVPDGRLDAETNVIQPKHVHSLQDFTDRGIVSLEVAIVVLLQAEQRGIKLRLHVCVFRIGFK
jgi:hypothetical protein